MALGKWMLAGCASLAMTSAVNAAFLNVTATADGFWTSNDGYAAIHPMAEINPLAIAPNSGVYQFQYTMTFECGGFTAPELGFGNMSFNMGVGDSGVTEVDAGIFDGWAADSGTVLVGKASALKWSLNQDGGINSADLNEIIVSIAAGLTATTDPRVKFGQTAPVFFGQAFFSIDSATAATGVVDTIDILSPGGWSTNNAGVFVGQSTGFTGEATVDAFQVVPEPASLSLLALGGLLARRRR